ncbi:MAG: hypothetical protein R6V77_06365, partial [Candidatus Cloacimonadaceae bacterium]
RLGQPGQKAVEVVGERLPVAIGINLDLPFLNEIEELVGDLGIQQINHSERTIEILLPSINVEACVKALHDKYIKRIG